MRRDDSLVHYTPLSVTPVRFQSRVVQLGAPMDHCACMRPEFLGLSGEELTPPVVPVASNYILFPLTTLSMEGRLQ